MRLWLPCNHLNFSEIIYSRWWTYTMILTVEEIHDFLHACFCCGWFTVNTVIAYLQLFSILLTSRCASTFFLQCLLDVLNKWWEKDKSNYELNCTDISEMGIIILIIIKNFVSGKLFKLNVNAKKSHGGGKARQGKQCFHEKYLKTLPPGLLHPHHHQVPEKL